MKIHKAIVEKKIEHPNQGLMLTLTIPLASGCTTKLSSTLILNFFLSLSTILTVC